MPGGGTRIYSCEHGQQFKAILVAKRLHIQLWAPTGRKPMAKVQVQVHCPMARGGWDELDQLMGSSQRPR